MKSHLKHTLQIISDNIPMTYKNHRWGVITKICFNNIPNIAVKSQKHKSI